MAGAWSMNEEGEFVLNEPYASQLAEVKHVGSLAWQQAVYDYLRQKKGYDPQYVHERMVERTSRDNVDAQALVDGVIIDALEGTL